MSDGPEVALNWPFPYLYNPLQRHHKRCKQKIEKDELRVGREIDNGDYLMTLWHHLGCWGDMDKGFGSDDMEVFEGLDASDQDEVRQALDEPVKKVKKGTCPFLHCPLPCGAGWRPRLSSLNPTRPSTSVDLPLAAPPKKTTPKANKETKKPAPLHPRRRSPRRRSPWPRQRLRRAPNVKSAGRASEQRPHAVVSIFSMSHPALTHQVPRSASQRSNCGESNVSSACQRAFSAPALSSARVLCVRLTKWKLSNAMRSV